MEVNGIVKYPAPLLGLGVIWYEQLPAWIALWMRLERFCGSPQEMVLEPSAAAEASTVRVLPATAIASAPVGAVHEIAEEPATATVISPLKEPPPVEM